MRQTVISEYETIQLKCDVNVVDAPSLEFKPAQSDAPVEHTGSMILLTFLHR